MDRAVYRGKFDAGWDELRKEIFVRQKRRGVVPAGTELTVRPKEIPAWSALNTNERALLARLMEVFAGFLAQTDYEVGRLLQAVQGAPGGKQHADSLYCGRQRGEQRERSQWRRVVRGSLHRPGG